MSTLLTGLKRPVNYRGETTADVREPAIGTMDLVTEYYLAELPSQTSGVSVIGTPDTASAFNEVVALPSQSGEFNVSYTTGKVTFHTSDLGCDIYIVYQGTGSILLADHITQLIDVIAGAGGFCVTCKAGATIAAGDCVRSSGDASGSPSIMVGVVAGKSTATCWGVALDSGDTGDDIRVQTYGIINGYATEAPIGSRIIVGSDGALTWISDETLAKGATFPAVGQYICQMGMKVAADSVLLSPSLTAIECTP